MNLANGKAKRSYTWLECNCTAADSSSKVADSSSKCMQADKPGKAKRCSGTQSSESST
jgi:hypothetical protein